ncbi:MAG: glycosyltransferase, partial [Syntrophomonadaceae bacterium]|nr:glycosyltransferase [Syntrophomonadaceae bacterium]
MRDNGIKKRQGISLVMIVKNEEEFLEYCLKSVAGLVNEIIIVDTGSTDASRDIAAKFGSRVFDFTWQDDFAAARNYGLEQARCEWILVLDADEHLEEPSAHMLLDLIDASGTADAYLLPVKNLMVPEFNEWQVSLILRLFRNSPDLRFQGTIHEQLIVPAGKRAEIAEDGPVIIHSGYAENNRKKKNRRNMRMLKKALEKDPDNPYLHYYISTEYILQGDFKTAWQYIDRALPRIPHDVILFRAALVRNAAVVLNELDNLELAEKLLLEEIKINPNFPDYHYFLANLYQKQDEHWLAVEHYNWAVT